MTTTILTQANFDETIEKNEIVLIDFWAEWCGPCKSFSEIYETVSNDYPDIVFGKVDIESETELANDFNVRSIPLLMVLKQKVVIFLESGLLPAPAVHDLIAQAKQLDMTEVLKKIKEQESKD